MKIAVTGATGLLGGQVVRAALTDGHEVTAIVRSTGPSQLDGLDVTQVRAGLENGQRLRSALREYFPAALAAFDDLTASDTLDLLGAAPDPQRAARLSRSRIADALKSRWPSR